MLSELRQGSRAAFSRIYSDYWRKLYTLAYNRLRSRQAAEDVVQEVLSGLWLRREAAEIASLEAYLATATKYAIIRQLANQATHQDAISQLDHGPIYYSDSAFLMQLLREEVNRLPEKCRLVFLYSRNDGLSNKEIAGKMAVSEKAVEKHISKALNRLRNKARDFFHLFTGI